MALFRKDIEPHCAWCRYSGPLTDAQLTCLKKGIVSVGGGCRRFTYDPLKRVPPRPAMPSFDRWKEEDFSL